MLIAARQTTDDEVTDEEDTVDEGEEGGQPVDGTADSPTADGVDVEGGDQGDGGEATGSPGGTDGDGGDGGGTSSAMDGEGSGESGSVSAYFEGAGGGGGGGSREFNAMADPIDLRWADKRHVQVDYLGKGTAPLRLAHAYHSNLGANPAQVTMPMGVGWRSFYDRSVQVMSGTQLRLHRANGRVLDFSFNGSAWVSTMPAGTLSVLAGGWQYVNHRNTVETYGSNGRLVSLSSAGQVTTMAYDAGMRLVQVTNPFGRSLSLAYDGAGRVATVALPGGGALAYGYDGQNNLTSTRFADNSTRWYKYESPGFPNALTGVVDETGRRRLTWGYDAAGRPNMGFFGAGVAAVTAVYNGSTVTTTDVRGTQRTRTYGSVASRPVLTSLQTAAAAGSAATGWTFSHDAAGNVMRVTSRSGEIRQLALDAKARPTNVTRAAGTPTALSAQATWHPVFRKRTQTQALGITRTATVDAHGRTTALTMTGTDGVTSNVLARVYNAQHLLQSSTDARGATTSYTYDAAGNRTSVTDALGQTTTFSGFNAHGQPGTVVRPDGTVVTRGYDLRGRLIARTVGGRTTTFAYDSSGRLTQTNTPAGGWRKRNYDSAGLLASITNHRSETKTISRDVDGKETGRTTYGATGGVAAAGSRQFNGHSRVAATLDASNNRVQWNYAADGRLASLTNPLGQTVSRQLDLLDRTTSVTQANTTAMRQAGGPATVSSSFSYHPTRAAAVQTTDTVAVATNFSTDRYNRRAAEVGADAGGKSWARNAAGDVTAMTDARGVVFSVARDGLGRVTNITPAGAVPTNISYPPGRRDGKPAAMTDISGSTAWAYDTVGRLTSKTQTVAGIARSLTLTRDTLGRVTRATYPSGMWVDFSYDAERVSSISVNGALLIGNISYRPFSAVATAWTWGNGSSYLRNIDANGRVTQVSLGSVQRSYGYDAAGRITSHTDTGPTGTQTTSMAYDEAGQLTSYAGPQGNFVYGYDSNGNRRSFTLGAYTGTSTFASGSNRILTSPNGNYTYNADGNPSSDGFYTFAYDPYGRVAAMNSADYRLTRRYNGQGHRVSSLTRELVGGSTARVPVRPGAAGIGVPLKSALASQATALSTTTAGASGKGGAVNATATWITTESMQYFHNDDGQLLGEYSVLNASQRQEIIWFNGQPVAVMINGALYNIYSDHLGTPRAIRLASNNLEVWRWDRALWKLYPQQPVLQQLHQLQPAFSRPAIRQCHRLPLQRDARLQPGDRAISAGRSDWVGWGDESVRLCRGESGQLHRSDWACRSTWCCYCGSG